MRKLSPGRLAGVLLALLAALLVALPAAAAADPVLRVVSQTQTTITFGWDVMPGADGYRFYADGVAVSRTFDPARVTVRFAKGSDSYAVKSLDVAETGTVGVYPAPVEPPPSTGFPDASNTGVPAGTTLTAYTGPCTVTAANTVIDSKIVDCDVVVQAANVTIRNSRVNGQVWLDQDLPGSSGWSMAIIDSEVDAGQGDVPAVCCGMYTLTRVNAHGGHNGAQCENGNQYCTIVDSYLHDPYQPPNYDSHLGGFLSDGSDNITLVHNTIWCNAPVNNVGGGCTGNINLIPNFAAVNGALIERNLLPANKDSSYCTYGGEKPSSATPHSYNVKYRDNVFQRGSNGKCAAYGPVTGFAVGNTGNVWSGNVWDDGTPVAPEN